MSVTLVGNSAKGKEKISFSLTEALEELSKDKLTMIRQNAAIKNVSKLNREQLKLACIEQLPSALAKELPAITALFDMSRVQRLKEAVKHDGVIVTQDEITEQEIQYWQQLGLLFYKEHNKQSLLLMPTELIDVVKQHLSEINMKLIEQNQALIEMAKGMLYYYGCLTHQQLEELIQRYYQIEQLKAPMMHLIISYRHYKYEYNLNEQFIYHSTIPDPSLIVFEQEKRAGLSFAPFTVAQLQQASPNNYIQRDEAHRLLVERLMKQLSLKQQDALLVADQCEFGIRAGLQLNDLIQYVAQELVIHDEQDLNKLMPSIVLLCNQTAQWLLKGHTAANLTKGIESNQQIEATASQAKTIGRNDPCYCGSGKKFKKCCINKG